MKFFLKTKMFSQTYTCRYNNKFTQEHPFSNNKYQFVYCCKISNFLFSVPKILVWFHDDKI